MAFMLVECQKMAGLCMCLSSRWSSPMTGHKRARLEPPVRDSGSAQPQSANLGHFAAKWLHCVYLPGSSQLQYHDWTAMKWFHSVTTILLIKKTHLGLPLQPQGSGLQL